MSRRLSSLALSALILLGFSGSPARAHLGSTKYLQVELGAALGASDAERGSAAERGVTVRASLETVDVAMQLGLDEEASAERVLARADDVAAWLVGGIQLRVGDTGCAVHADTPAAEQRDERSFIGVTLHFRCPAGDEAIVLRDDTVFPDDRQHEALVYVGGRGDAATVLRSGSRELGLGGGAQTGADLAATFLWEGMLHFALGYDHVLFLLSLLLGVGLGATPGGARPDDPAAPPRDPATSPRRPSLRALLQELAWLVTAFTLGHSVTLALAALELVVLPSQPVEIAIAASIVVVAVHTAASPRRRRALPLVAGAFGLIHGFGFSSVLREVGLPPGETVLALVSFNVGIELAQLVFVVLALPLLRKAAESARYERVVVRGGSLAIALVASYWVVERALSAG